MIDFLPITDLMDVISSLVPEGTEQCVETQGNKIILTNKDGKVGIDIQTIETKFNDKYVKEEVSEFMSNLKLIDDDMFIDIYEELRNVMDCNKFDSLLELKEYNQEEADLTLDMIAKASSVIKAHLNNKITSLTNLYSRF